MTDNHTHNHDHEHDHNHDHDSEHEYITLVDDEEMKIYTKFF